MVEILWHGRGGQGAFTAARLLGAAASSEDGAYALAFPSFGPERRGAPMRAFTKIDTKPIGDRSAIECADFVVYLDDTLLGDNWAAELKDGGRVLVNSVRSTESFGDERIIAIDANGLSEEFLGRPIPNTVFLGALAVLCEHVSRNAVEEAIEQYMPSKLHEKNKRIVAEAYERVSAALGSASEVASAAANVSDTPNVSRETFAADVSANVSAKGSSTVVCAKDSAEEPSSRAQDVSRETSSAPSALSAPARPAAHIPLLRSQIENPPSLEPRDYARTTCYEAGHLVSKNAGWRNERPVIDAEKCTGCLQCYLYCPDGTVFKTQQTGEGGSGVSGGATEHGTTPAPLPAVAIDYDFCKGCGVCVKACPFDAITMIPESEVSVR